MPDTSSYSGYPVPLMTERPDLPSAMRQFRDAIEGHTVLFAESTSDRDARYSTAPVGTIVSIPSVPSVWLKRGTGNTWYEIDDGTYRSWQVVPQSAFTADWANVNTKWRIVNGTTQFYLLATYTGNVDIVATPNGHIGNFQLLTLPAAASPDTSGGNDVIETTFSSGTGGGILSTYFNGGVWITTLLPNQVITNGDSVRGHATYTKRGI